MDEFFFPALPSEYETLSVNNWKFEKNPWNKHAKSNCKRTVPFGNKAVKPQKLHSSG